MIASPPSRDRYLYQRHHPPALENHPVHHYHNHDRHPTQQHPPAAYTSAPELGANTLTTLVSAVAAPTTPSPQRTALTSSTSIPSFASSSSVSSTGLSISSSLRRKPSYTKRSLKATHRIAIRRIISESHSQQQQDLPALNHNQYYQQQLHNENQCRSCPSKVGMAPSRTLSPSSSYPDVIPCPHQSSPGPSNSRRGVVTEAVFRDQYPCWAISPSSQGAKAHDYRLYPRSPSVSTPPCIPRFNASDPALPFSVSLASPTSTSFPNRSAPLSAISSCPSSASSSSSSSSSSTTSSLSPSVSTSTSSSCYYSLTSNPTPLSPCTPSSKHLASPYPLDRSCDSFHDQDSPRRQPLSSIASTAELQASVVAQGRACRPAYQEQHLQQKHCNQRIAPPQRLHIPPRMTSLPLPDPCCSCTLPTSNHPDRPADRAVASPLSSRHEHEHDHEHDHEQKHHSSREDRPDRPNASLWKARSPANFQSLSSSLSAPSLLSSTTHSLAPFLTDKRSLSTSASWTMPSQTQVVLREILSSQSHVRHTLHQNKIHTLKSLLPSGSRSRPSKSRKVGDESHLPRRRSTLRRKDSSSYNRSSELLRPRRQTTPKFARYLDMKPLPLVRSVSVKKGQGAVEPKLEKPLPPIPRSYDLHGDMGMGGKACIDTHPPSKESLDECAPEQEYLDHDHSPLCADLPHKQDFYEATTTTDLPSKDSEDNHQPAMSTDQRNDHSAKQCIEAAPSVTTDALPAQSLDSQCTLPDTDTTRPSLQLDLFRFPMRKSPTERRLPARSRTRHHRYHQSLPVNIVRLRPRKVADGTSLSPLDALHHTRCSSTATSVSTASDQEFATSDIIKALTGQSEKSQLTPGRNKWSRISDREKKKDRGSSSSTTNSATEKPHYRSGRLRRSESCSSSTLAHRPSLSFNSSKKALLSLQSRRINKPDAKVHRLPEIQTTSVPARPLIVVEDVAVVGDSASVAQQLTTNNGAGLTEAVEKGSVKIDSNKSSSVILQQEETFLSDMTDYQLQVSEKDRLAIDTILQELATPDSFKSGSSDPSLSASAMLTRTCSAPVIVQGDSSLHSHQDPKAPTPNSTGAGTTLDNSSGSTLPSPFHSSLVIDPRSIMEAGESKRFVKRSHALRELVSTEKSYVSDLDTLVNVHLRLLRSKSWFPRTTHSNLLKCTNGLLFTHRRFLSVLDDNLITGADRDQAPLSVYQTLAESFKIMCEDRELYDDFCEQRMRAVKTINRYEGTTTLLTLQRESKDMMIQQGRLNVRVDLKDLLIKPIQRICRYPLLLKEVLRLTSLEDPEYCSVEESHKRMKDLAQDLDSTQKKVERKLLTEQFLKKLDETNLPKKYVFTLFVTGNAANSIVDPPNSHNSRNSYNGNNLSVYPLQASGDQQTTGALQSPAGTSHSEYFDHGLGAEGVVPSPLTREFVGSLGSILLAGALEFVLIPEIPIRLKYYGCFLFESMLIVVKPRKASQYEPRQWLPLRLCELQETTRLDGYTRYGWSLIFDQFRIDFGASGEEEQEIWMRNLRVQIQAAKDAYARLPIGLAAFQTLTSSLPWKMTKAQARSVMSARQLQQQHLILSPSITTSPWSTNSSALSSPSLSSAAFSFGPSSYMTSSLDGEKLNSRGRGTMDEGYEPKETRPTINESCQQAGTRLSTATAENGHRIGGMAASDHPQGIDTPSNPSPSRAPTQTLRPHQTSHLQHHQQQQHHHQQQLPSAHLLPPGSPAPWLLSENRSRTHTFDVTRVFTSSHNGGIKPNQRTLVQNMFKDISAENFWTTASTSSAHPGTPTPQGGNSTPMSYSPCLSSASALSPLPSVSSSRHGSSSPLPLPFWSTSNTSSPSQSGVILSGMARSAVAPEGDADNVGAPLRSAGSSSTSLTSRILRRRDSGNRQSPNGTVHGLPEKSDWDRRRNSATAAIAATLALNFRKNAEPQPSFQHLRRSSMHNDPLFAGSSDHPLQETQDGLYQRISVKARAQLFERRASSFHSSNSSINTVPISSSPLSSKPHTGSGHKIKTSQSHHDISSLQMTPTVRRSSSIQQQQTTADTLQTLSSAAEAAQSRRGTLRRSIQIGSAASPSSSFLAPASSGSLLPPPTAAGAYESHRARASSAAGESGDNSIDKIWTAMGRITHLGKSHSSGRLSSMGQSSQYLHPLHLTADSSVSSRNSAGYDQGQQQHPWDTTTPLSTPRFSCTTLSRQESSSSATPRDAASTPPSNSSPVMAPIPFSPATRATATASEASTSDSCVGSNGGSSAAASTISATHSRSFSEGTNQSTDSDSSLNYFRSGQTMDHHLFFSSSPSSSPRGSTAGPRLTLTPSVSVTSCASISSTDVSSIYSNPLSITDQPHSLAHMNDYPAPLTPIQSRSSDLYHPGLLPNEGSKLSVTTTNTSGYGTSSFPSPSTTLEAAAKNTSGGPSPTAQTAATTTTPTTTPTQERRKSLSVLQTFTHSASQKFKTMIRSPSGLRRRSVMSLSPMTLERSPTLISSLNSTAAVGEHGDGEGVEEGEEEN
ncbi:hypothetical protein EMPS_11528 [Entomortierella parvispora]|uniref:DH domain-containing protein n=1 Tax=Entomortierella parvispora TaxID=205924 RepID=A0A9P3HLX0_9FUNG|nr:hypothetical protein EMPS_11528 [Entomortierella parvispora]